MKDSNQHEQPGQNEAQPKKIDTRYIALCAVFVALVFAATFFLNIPASIILGAGGNINLGDSVIFIAAAFLGPFGGMICGGIGATIADIAGGYMIYAPFTLIIKGLAGFVCGLIFKMGKGNNLVKRLISILAAALIIIIGYFFAEIAILAIAGADEFAVIMTKASLTIVPNILQTSISGFISVIALYRVPQISLFRKEKY